MKTRWKKFSKNFWKTSHSNSRTVLPNWKPPTKNKQVESSTKIDGEKSELCQLRGQNPVNHKISAKNEGNVYVWEI